MQTLRRQPLPGKRKSGAQVNAALPREIKGSSQLLFATDSHDGTRWLIDGGAVWSIIPPTQQQRDSGPNAWKLEAANGSTIPCYGLTDRDVCIADRSFTDHSFIIADVRQPILGADFLSRYYLAPNHRDKTLIDLSDGSEIPVGINRRTQTRFTDINLVDQKSDPFYQLLDSYPALSTPSFTPKEVSHGVRHYIPTNCHPIQSKVRKLNPEKLEIAKQEFEKLVALGVCYRGKSEWASPLMVATKPCCSPCTCAQKSPCGGWRVCGDYRRLNTETADDKYPVKTLTDFNNNLSGKTIFSKIDLLKGYHQIPVNEADIGKTAVITPFGLYIFPRCPFGLKNAGQDFQRMMDAILGDLPFCFVYLDDILVFSNNRQEHLEHLRQIFDILAANGLVVNRAKCILGVTQLNFLGFHVDKDGITPLQEKVDAINATKAPTTIKELQRFLGMVGYYRRCIKAAAHHLDHLFGALEGKPKKLNWTEDCAKSFEATKKALANYAMLHHPRPNANLALTTDASKVAIGGVLEQRGPSGWEPLAFFSARLRDKQPEWPPFDRELLAAFRAIRHFRHMLEGRVFTLYTDHQSLVPALSKKTEPHTARQTYQLSTIAEYTTDIRYLQGKANVVADALSRPNGESNELGEHAFITAINCIQAGNVNCICASSVPAERPTAVLTDTTTSTESAQNNKNQQTPINMADKQLSGEKTDEFNAIVNSITELGIDFNEMARAQPLDADFRRISTDPNCGLTFRKVPVGQHNLFVDVSNGPARPFVPFAWRRQVFNSIHGLGHPGIERTRQMMREKFVWPSLRADVSKWARECVHCQLAKVGRNTVPAIHEFKVPDKRFAHVHADITMMPESQGFRYLLTMVDRFTRWPAAVPLKDISTESVVNAFAHGWIASFGIPQTVTTDRGSQFTSEVWAQLLSIWGIKRSTTTAYHPEANGLVERFHRRLKESLMALCGEERNEWYWKLPMALLSIRTTLKPDVGASPADLVYGEGLAVPGDLLPNYPDNEANNANQRNASLANLRLEVERLVPKPTSAHRQANVHVPDDLESATHVMIRRGGVHPPLTQPYEGPYQVQSRTETGIKVHLPGRGVEEIALARVKPAFIEANDNPQQPQQQQPPPPPPSPPPGPPPPQGPLPTSRATQPMQRLINPTTRNTRQNVRNAAATNQPAPQAPRLDPEVFDDGTLDDRLARLRDRPVAVPAPPPNPVTDPIPGMNNNPSPPHDDKSTHCVPADPNLPGCPCDDPNADAFFDPGEGTSRGPANPADTPHQQRFFSNPKPGHFSFRPRSKEPTTKPQTPAKPKTLSFSNPKPGNFSYRRRKPDINALRAIIESLND